MKYTQNVFDINIPRTSHSILIKFAGTFAVKKIKNKPRVTRNSQAYTMISKIYLVPIKRILSYFNLCVYLPIIVIETLISLLEWIRFMTLCVK